MDKLHNEKWNDDKIMRFFVHLYETKECDIEDLETMAGWLGYTLNDEFYKR